jgi:hypothetical protein
VIVKARPSAATGPATGLAVTRLAASSTATGLAASSSATGLGGASAATDRYFGFGTAHGTRRWADAVADADDSSPRGGVGAEPSSVQSPLSPAASASSAGIAPRGSIALSVGAASSSGPARPPFRPSPRGSMAQALAASPGVLVATGPVATSLDTAAATSLDTTPSPQRRPHQPGPPPSLGPPPSPTGEPPHAGVLVALTAATTGLAAAITDLALRSPAVCGVCGHGPCDCLQVALTRYLSKYLFLSVSSSCSLVLYHFIC